MSDYRFETPGPVQLYCEAGRGSVRVTAADTMETLVTVRGPVADQVVVAQEGGEIRILAPMQRTGFFGGEPQVDIEVSLPVESDAFVRTSSADITLDGAYAACVLRSGSGDVKAEILGGPGQVETGSGDVSLDTASAELRIKSGSGDVQIRFAGAGAAISTGSGDVRIETAHGPTAVKTGSGDLLVDDADGDVSLATGSGDLVVGTARRGRLTVKGASGDVLVGVPHGLPVWTDINTLTGSIRSSLPGAGEPEEGADHLEIRATTVSGDIVLRPV